MSLLARQTSSSIGVAHGTVIARAVSHAFASTSVGFTETPKALLAPRHLVHSSSSSLVAAPRIHHRSFASSSPMSDASDATDVVVTKLYRGAHIKTFRVLVRLKLAQLAAVGGLATPFLAIGAGEDVSSTLIAAAVAGGIGSAACAAALQYYASRYVGELALTRRPGETPKLRVSTMDFWGARVDEHFTLSRVVPPLKGLSGDAKRTLAEQAFIPLDVIGARQYVLSLRFGELSHRAALFDALSAGEHSESGAIGAGTTSSSSSNGRDVS